MKKAISFAYCCAVLFHLAAQPYGYIQYNVESGAPFDQVSTVIQDSEGFVWVGSQSGLYRFDGIHFDLYSLHTESQFIHQLHSAGGKLLFLNEMGLYQIQNLQANPEINTILEGTIVESDQNLFYPNDFVKDKQQRIWISQSNHSIARIEDGTFQTYPFSKSEAAQKLSIQEDGEGHVWVLSPVDGLFRFNQATNAFAKQLDIQNANTLLIYGENILIGSNDLMVYSMGNGEPVLEHMVTLGDDQITAIHKGEDDQYIMGTHDGKLLKFEGLDSPPEMIYGANEAHRVEQLDFGHIYEVHIVSDPEGIDNTEKLWVCSETGLWLLQQRFFETVDLLPMNNPIGIAMGKDEKAWIPMNYLYEITSQEGEFMANQILRGLAVNAVAEDANGFLWVTTSNPRVEMIKYDNNRVIRRYDLHHRGESIFYLFPDSKGNVWFCQAPEAKPIVGTAMITATGEMKYYGSEKGFSSRVLAIKESSRGEIYAVGIGERSYLYRYDPQNDHFVNLSPPLPFTPMLNFEAHDLTIDDRGIVWLATTDGLLRYDSEKITLIKDDILGQEEVRGVTHYSNNNIWISTATRGLVFHQQDISTALGEQEGLPSVISSYRCITTDAQGRLWAGTPEGLVYSHISAATLPYSNTPRLRKLIIDNEEYTSGLQEAITIQKNQSLELEFINLAFPSRNVQYQYRLLPEEEKQIMLEEQLWQSNGSSNSLSLNQIELGQYHLELRARQPGGYQWSQPLELELSVFIPWYSEPWFIYGLTGVLVLVIAYYLRSTVIDRFGRLQQIVNYANQRIEQQEAQLLEKTQKLEVEQEALANASSNIETLELFIKGIPNNASWNDIITAMGKAVRHSDDINAFEIAFIENDEIVHRGYSDQERSGYTFRTKPFDVKVSLTCWAMSNNKEVLIHDFEKEHPQYISTKEGYRFESLLFIPFTLENNQNVVLCAYSIRKNDFDENDLVMFRILAQFIQNSIRHELTKET